MSLRKVLATIGAPSRDAAIVVVGQGTALVALALATAVVARQVGPATYGTFAAALSFLGLFAIIAEAGTNQVFIRRVVSDPSSAPEALAAALKVRMTTSVVATFLCLGSAAVAGLSAPQLAFIPLALTLVTAGVGSLFLTTFNARHRFAAYAGLRALEAVVTGAALITAAIVWGSVFALAAATLIANFVYYGLVVLWASHGSLPARRQPADWLMLRPGAWFAATWLITYLASRATVALAETNLEGQALGSYAAGFRLFDPLVLLAGSIMTSAFPRAVLRHRSGITSVGATAWTSLGMGLVGCAGAGVLWLAAPWLVKFVFGAEFTGATSVFRVLLLGFPVTLATIPTSLLADATGHQRLHVINGLVMVLSTFTVLFVATPALGSLGPAWGVVAGQVAGALFGIPLILAVVHRNGVAPPA